jgi:hypothetical protein
LKVCHTRGAGRNLASLARRNEGKGTMARKKTTAIAPPPLPPAVRVAVYPPRVTEPDETCTLADKCTAAGAANPTTIGMSPFLAPIATGSATVKLDIPLANGGSLVAKSSLLAATRTLHGSIMAHGGWIDAQMLTMTPAAAAAYAVSAGFTTSKTGTHGGITAMGVKNGPVGSSLLICEFPSPRARCLSCTEYSVNAQQTWTRGPDTETNRVTLPAVFTAGQTVNVRLRMFLRGTGYTPWDIFTLIVV